MIVDDTHVILSQGELDALDEYSCSIPTGMTIGKRWKNDASAYSYSHCRACAIRQRDKLPGKCEKHIAPIWTVAEYVPIETVPPFQVIPGHVGIRYRKVLEIIPGKAPVS